MAIVDDRRIELDGAVVHVVVEAEVTTFSDGKAMLGERATISARHAGCGGLEVEAAAGSYFFALGRQDAITGHPAFDDRYIVKTSDVEAMRYWLGADELDAVLSTYDPHALHPYTLSLDADEVKLVGAWDRDGSRREGGLFVFGDDVVPRIPYRATLARGVDEAAAAVATLAGRGARLAASWRARLAPLGVADAGDEWRADGRYALTALRGRTRVRIDFPWQLHPLRRRGLRTRLAIAWPDGGAAAAWPRTWSWRTRPRLARAQDLELPPPWSGEARDTPALAALPDLAGALTAAGVDWLLVADGALAIGWERIVDTTDRLAAAIAQLARWADRVAPAAGPYR